MTYQTKTLWVWKSTGSDIFKPTYCDGNDQGIRWAWESEGSDAFKPSDWHRIGAGSDQEISALLDILEKTYGNNMHKCMTWVILPTGFGYPFHLSPPTDRYVGLYEDHLTKMMTDEMVIVANYKTDLFHIQLAKQASSKMTDWGWGGFVMHREGKGGLSVGTLETRYLLDVWVGNAITELTLRSIRNDFRVYPKS